jgi:hypothetical protein
LNRSSRELEIKIIGLWLEGNSRDFIAQSLGVSGSTVTDIVDPLPKSLGELKEQNFLFKKAGLQVSTLRETLQIIALKAPEGFNPERLPNIVEYSFRAAADKNYQMDAVLNASTRLIQLEKQTGKDYPEAISEFEEKASLNKKLDEEIQQEQRKNHNLKKINTELNQQIEINRQRNKRMLNEADVTEKDIAAFSETRKTLQRIGIDICHNQELIKLAKEHVSLKQANKAERNELQEIRAEEKETIIECENARLTANKENERAISNKAMADSLQKIVEYRNIQAFQLGCQLTDLNAKIQKGKCTHDAILT